MHENEKQQSVEQGNSMTNRGDRRKKEETIKFTGEWQMWRVSSEYLDLCLLQKVDGKIMLVQKGNIMNGQCFWNNGKVKEEQFCM